MQRAERLKRKSSLRQKRHQTIELPNVDLPLSSGDSDGFPSQVVESMGRNSPGLLEGSVEQL